MNYANESLILCPYCLSLVEDKTVICHTCKEDTTRDAKVEMSQAEYDSKLRKPCPSCNSEIMVLTAICPNCLAVLKW